MGISFDFLLHVGLQVLLVLDLMLLCIISSVYQFAFCATWLDDLHPGFQIREILLERATHEPEPTSVADDDGQGVVALIRVASQRAANTKEERKELAKMAKRLRKTKRKLLKKQQTNVSNNQCKEGSR